MENAPKVRTCLWFESQGKEAAEFYVGLFPGSAIERVEPPITELTLAGTPYLFLDGGPHYTLSPAASIMVRTEDQVETDRLWNALIADGGRESRCAWLVDRFGVSWQIVPEALMRLLSDSDRAAAGRARDAMMGMAKIDIAALERAFAG